MTPPPPIIPTQYNPPAPPPRLTSRPTRNYYDDDRDDDGRIDVGACVVAVVAVAIVATIGMMPTKPPLSRIRTLLSKQDLALTLNELWGMHSSVSPHHAHSELREHVAHDV